MTKQPLKPARYEVIRLFNNPFNSRSLPRLQSGNINRHGEIRYIGLCALMKQMGTAMNNNGYYEHITKDRFEVKKIDE